MATHQAVQAPSQQVHGTHLHGGGGEGGPADRGAQVQVEQIPQQVALRGDDGRLLRRLPGRGGCLGALSALAPAGKDKGPLLEPPGLRATQLGFVARCPTRQSSQRHPWGSPPT